MLEIINRIINEDKNILVKEILNNNLKNVTGAIKTSFRNKILIKRILFVISIDGRQFKHSELKYKGLFREFSTFQKMVEVTLNRIVLEIFKVNDYMNIEILRLPDSPRVINNLYDVTYSFKPFPDLTTDLNIVYDRKLIYKNFQIDRNQTNKSTVTCIRGNTKQLGKVMIQYDMF